MKRFLLALALIVPLGCGAVHTTTPPAVLAPGYANAADQKMGDVLAGARSFYVTIQQDSLSGKVMLSATEKTAFNKFALALNAAEEVYTAFHNGTASQSAAQKQVDAVQAQQNALPALAVSK